MSLGYRRAFHYQLTATYTFKHWHESHHSRPSRFKPPLSACTPLEQHTSPASTSTIHTTASNANNGNKINYSAIRTTSDLRCYTFSNGPSSSPHSPTHSRIHLINLSIATTTLTPCDRCQCRQAALLSNSTTSDTHTHARTENEANRNPLSPSLGEGVRGNKNRAEEQQWGRSTSRLVSNTNSTTHLRTCRTQPSTGVRLASLAI